ncbi:MAG: ribose 5-phosphate isomerase B [Bacilli bacterium]|nr:ribose 5-phosphate isomerase B [Bacilli bacterium]
MKLSIASDHGGFLLKEEVKNYLIEKGYDVIDEGCYSQDRVDYPVYASKVCKDVQDLACVGVLICTSGIGMSMCANKHKGIRAALVMNEDAAKFSRLHNNANVICMGAKYLNKEEACHFIEVFLETEFEGGRHEKRVEMINNLDK